MLLQKWIPGFEIVAATEEGKNKWEIGYGRW